MSLVPLGVLLALAIGIGCRLLDVPLPAPPRLEGALLVVAMTAGFLAADALLPSPGAGSSRTSPLSPTAQEHRHE